MARRGRPEFAPTKAQRERVKLLKAVAWPNERIAAQIIDPKSKKPICRNTLEKAFAEELEWGADAKRVENIEAMQAAAKKGNASAGKWLAEKFDAGRAHQSLEDRAQPGTPTEQPRAPALGKKEQQTEAARRVEGKFAPPPGPPKQVH